MKISVVIPCFNADMFLAETIDSILNQTVKPHEIVIIDDASSDTSRQIAHEHLHGRKDISTQSINHEENQGIGVSRQHGVEEAKGDHIAFLSADDVYHPQFIESSVKYLDGETATHTDYYRWNYLSNASTVFRAPPYKRQDEFRQLVIKWALRKNMFVNFSSIIVPKWWFNHVAFESKLKHGEDLILLLDTVLNDFKWNHVGEPLLYYRLHPQQGTRTQGREEWNQLWEYNKERLMKLGVDEETITAAFDVNRDNTFPSLWRRAISKVQRIMKESKLAS